MKEGYQLVDIAQIVGVERLSILRWKAAYKRNSQKGLVANPVPGRPPKLDTRDKKKLGKMLLKGAITAGVNTENWICQVFPDHL